MRLPNESQLSPEQKEVCYAPTNQSIIVTGPPGSGKTVVAIFRYNSLKKREETVETVVFTNVLKRYTNIDRTFHSWMESWWKKCANRENFPGSWVNGRRSWDWDFDIARRKVMEDFKDGFTTKGHWGHLILDEAQDFSSAAHSLLCMVQKRVFGDLEPVDRPHITLLADENQRLTNTSSTIAQIKDAYLLSGEQLYTLELNYRNTQEIAALAAHFYVGLGTGIPKTPTKKGDKPKLIVTEKLDEAVTKITNHMLLHEDEEIGVLVEKTATRKKFFNKLSHRLKDTDVKVQTYPTQDQKGGNHLVFDEPSHITVVCFASSKGLEFDTVFLPELQEFNATGREEHEAKMALYVMISRARDSLFLMITDPQGQRRESIWNLLPKDSNLLEIE